MYDITNPLFTTGHGTSNADGLLELLATARIRALVDVRTAPGSRRNPEVNRTNMEQWLPEHRISYRWEPRLGGWRKPDPNSPDVGLRNRSFAGYAAHMRSAEFHDAVDILLHDATVTPTVVMCSESLWWRCHRRLIADFAVLARQMSVRHLMHDGRLVDHSCTDAARLTTDGLLVYDQCPRD